MVTKASYKLEFFPMEKEKQHPRYKIIRTPPYQCERGQYYRLSYVVYHPVSQVIPGK